MKKVSTDNAFLTFLLGAVVTVIAFLALSLIGKEQYLYNFFFRFWPVQVMTSWLFFSSLLFVVFRFVQLGRERIILSEKLAVESLDTISPQDAKEISEVIPEKYRASLGFRRIGELLKGYLHGEEIVRLNQELSRRDVEQIEGGHLVLDALKQLIPVLGFLGTVIGLSLGMAKFPEISKSAGSIDQLRFVLKDFAASLSVAFDTTLLALGYTVVIVLISSLLRRREESFVSEVDEKARDLISKLMLAGEAGEPVESGAGGISAGIVEGMKEYFDGIAGEWVPKWKDGLATLIKEAAGELSARNRDQGEKILGAFSENARALLSKLDEMMEAFREPPHYEIRVNPVGNKRDEEDS